MLHSSHVRFAAEIEWDIAIITLTYIPVATGWTH